eukprot:TRINITY_DN2350_c0_g1_i2.p1 TRINITY_DN2350_c0_g1~~TRINITY_DN2350_c0_g1_i2.p1  ORF type:complete len:601 (+),score=99.42 TRINITY_DN2350_c0_g1_i2:101-1903(+)
MRGSYSLGSDIRPKNLNYTFLKRIFTYAKGFYSDLILLLAFNMIMTVFSLMQTIMVGVLIDDAAVQNLKRFGVAGDDRDTNIHYTAAVLVGFFVLDQVVSYWQKMLKMSISQKMTLKMQGELLKKVQRMPVHFFKNVKPGEVSSRLNSDVTGAQNFLTSSLLGYGNSVLKVLFTLMTMLNMNWKLTIASLLSFPIIYFPSKYFSAMLKENRKEVLALKGEARTLESEFLSTDGFTLARIFGRTNDIYKKWEDIKIEQNHINTNVGKGQSIFSSFKQGSSQMVEYILRWTCAMLVVSGEFSAGDIITFLALFKSFQGPASSLASIQVDFSSKVTYFERIFEVMDMEDLLVEPETPVNLDLKQVEGRIVFDFVSFSYSQIPEKYYKLPEAERPWRDAMTPKRGNQNRKGNKGKQDDEDPYVLKDISFTIQPGTMVAVIGASGAGKSTLAQLIPRLYDPTEGNIYIDDINMKSISFDDLTSLIGVVTQETYIFFDTLKENILFARPDATDEEVIEACKQANLWELVQSLPEGIDTVLGDRGYRLSGGERQRIAIARVFLKNSKILVLDEATSSLDSVNEKQIQDAFNNLTSGRSSFVIAHRFL